MNTFKIQAVQTQIQSAQDALRMLESELENERRELIEEAKASRSGWEVFTLSSDFYGSHEGDSFEKVYLFKWGVNWHQWEGQHFAHGNRGRNEVWELFQAWLEKIPEGHCIEVP